MDIDLLSKMVKELILDDDRVVLPGLGCFVAEIVPASFSDKGYTINPPYRRLYFRSRPDEGEALVDFYAKSNGLEQDVAERIIRDYLSELKSVLLTRKVVVFPGLGRLRATKENNLFFVADEDLDIYPEGFGLEPISLKTHKETSAEVTAAVVDLKNILDDVSPEPEVTPETEPVVEQEDIAGPEPESVSDGGSDQEAEAQSEQESAAGQDPEQETAVQEVEPEQEAASQESDQDTETEQEAAADQEPEPEPAAEPDQEPIFEVIDETSQAKKSSGKVFLKVLAGLLIAAVVILAAYMVVGRICPEWIDQFLYTPEEIEILKR